MMDEFYFFNGINLSTFSDLKAETLVDICGENGIRAACGATKFCIINEDHVLKFPMRGEQCDGFQVFRGTDGRNSNWNYCEKEVEVYEDAKEKGLEMFFAEVKEEGYITDENGNALSYYKQDKVPVIGEGEKIMSNADYKKASEATSNAKYSELPAYWVASAVDFFGLEKVVDLLKFLKEQCLSDFHNANIGFMADGAPILFDYSGYNS